ncbi:MULTISPECIES: CDP-6-deoxy-delta-3,4-glucoseen reductase [Halorhodospira]|uniref:CDP-6-deoxy-delta-3,4-glucoseen reductase n=1 Tax=Halorhodospira TaxID=85108 RepID=UPI001EE811D1|nr:MULTISPECIES: CDP-6-deoxy-delta-3,4-glucoseen reductase [Halorhodospira]MCG5527265.1 CDP-6-deoxy-delta-3,4-glucoseen reductase [Halorhodospira halophila]MCG5543391.1 CDP-6-deoxy-delta-3,4-glucoseen reductase [Halorhodospira sp. 9628]
MTYTVRFSDGTEIGAEPDEAVLDAALRQGVSLPYGCRNGVCGTCRAPVRAGEIRYPPGQPKALDDAERAAGLALLCQARPASDLAVDLEPLGDAAAPPRILPARVARIEHLAPSVCRLFLRLPEDKRLPFRPGQYIDVLLADGERRAFSLASSPLEDDHLELHIRHIPGGRFTDHVFQRMREGELLRIEGPLGQLYLRDDGDRPALLVGGGTGFGPLKGILEHALARGDRRRFHLYWGTRERAGLYLDDLARRWAETYPGVDYTPVLSEPGAEDAWDGRVGWVHEAVVHDHPDLSGFDVYMSGPPPMTEAARAAFLEHGLNPERLFYDAFHFSHE